jgi:hypothetical protein
MTADADPACQIDISKVTSAHFMAKCFLDASRSSALMPAKYVQCRYPDRVRLRWPLSLTFEKKYSNSNHRRSTGGNHRDSRRRLDTVGNTTQRGDPTAPDTSTSIFTLLWNRFPVTD